MATALRPWVSAAVISSRKGSHALALGTRSGGGGAGPEPVVTTSVMVAGFGGGHTRG